MSKSRSRTYNFPETKCAISGELSCQATGLVETLQVFLSWSVDVHVVLGLSSDYFYQLLLLFRLNLFPVRLLLE